ncbi:hypothetical protein HYW75_02615 [Candidatus Pacearchaeota archaeon]|nr:hypothetical protein [Candidatus Pacearchaeota archaeon]
MSIHQRLSNYEITSRYQLVREASRILNENGLSIRGRHLEVENWQQYQYEVKMHLGAYCGKNARKRK